ncbi:ABC transporter ATP-binding protein [bacterium]|nr:ABC transporter ATP-binding protein [bacterium]
MSIKRSPLSQPLLLVKNLTIRIDESNRPFNAVQNLSFSIYRDHTLALVGESGSGKTITALTLLGLLPKRAKSVAGEITCLGKTLSSENRKSEKSLVQLRGRDIAMIFQEPRSALNPVISVGCQVVDVILRHRKVSAKTARRQTEELLEVVGLTDPKSIYQSYPHELSGGMCQRVMIAMALSCRPKLIIADEPTTALDVTTQTQILRLIRDLQARYHFGLLLISHDLSVVSKMADWTVVMRSGTSVEEGPTEAILNRPQHIYTRSLVDAMFKMPAATAS